MCMYIVVLYTKHMHMDHITAALLLTQVLSLVQG